MQWHILSSAPPAGQSSLQSLLPVAWAYLKNSAQLVLNAVSNIHRLPADRTRIYYMAVLRKWTGCAGGCRLYERTLVHTSLPQAGSQVLSHTSCAALESRARLSAHTGS